MALVPANSLMGMPRTTDEHQGRPVVTLFTGQDNIRAAMEEFCVNASPEPTPPSPRTIDSRTNRTIIGQAEGALG